MFSCFNCTKYLQYRPDTIYKLKDISLPLYTLKALFGWNFIVLPVETSKSRFICLALSFKLPYCVEVCPTDARIFGDLDDPDSEVTQLLGQYMPSRLREDLGTEPKVYYVRSFQPGGYEKTKGGLE